MIIVSVHRFSLLVFIITTPHITSTFFICLFYQNKPTPASVTASSSPYKHGRSLRLHQNLVRHWRRKPNVPEQPTVSLACKQGQTLQQHSPNTSSTHGRLFAFTAGEEEENFLTTPVRRKVSSCVITRARYYLPCVICCCAGRSAVVTLSV